MTTHFINPSIKLKSVSVIKKTEKTIKKRNNPFFYLVGLIIIVSYFSYQITKERGNKKEKEIENIKAKSYKYDNDTLCEQYSLRALINGYFPCYQKSCNNGLIWLNKDEVWKYGKTCLGQKGRYPEGFSIENLYYQIEFKGTEKECLVTEKEKIYNYPFLPEAQIRNIKLLRPPGNKIDK